jgi:hypothetical protein
MSKAQTTTPTRNAHIERTAKKAPEPQLAWIDLPTAAARSGRHPRHLARLCRENLKAAGLAMLRQPAGGGKAVWFVRSDADPSFAGVRPADEAVKAIELSAVTIEGTRVFRVEQDAKGRLFGTAAVFFSIVLADGRKVRAYEDVRLPLTVAASESQTI